MKILHISCKDTEGAGNAALRHCDAMVRNGLNAKMLVMKKKTNYDFVYQVERSFLKQKIHHLFTGLHHKITKLIRFGNVVFDFNIWDEHLWKNKLVQEADIIYIHWCNDFVGFKDIDNMLRMNKKVVFFLHDMWTLTGGCHHAFDCNGYKAQCKDCPQLNKMKWGAFALMSKKKNMWQDEADILIASPSNWLAQCSKDSVLFKNHHVLTVPNVIDTDLFSPKDKITVRNKLSLNKYEHYLIFSAMSIDNPYKGFSYLLDVLNRLQDENIGYVVVGPNNPENFPCEVVEKTYFTGYVKTPEEMAEWYNAADVHISTSLAENFPNVIIETMACGVPTVAFTTGGIVDQIRDRENGRLVDQKDSKGMAEAIKWVLDANNYNVLSCKSRQSVCDKFSYNQVKRLHNPVFDIFSLDYNN